MIKNVNAVTSLSGSVQLPGDKSISHRYALLAAISEGTSIIRHFAASRDCHSTLECLQTLGVELSESGETITIHGRGLRGLCVPKRTLDAGNSGTTMRLLSGILAGHPFESTLSGDASLSKRPMGRIIRPLQLMGAAIESRERDLPPLRIRGGSLKGIRYALPVASAQVKSCVLLAGLYGKETTAVEETIPTRDHTEIALREFGCAAFFIVAAALIPTADITLPGVGLNERRRELLNYLLRAGADLIVENEREEAGEPRGDVRVRYSATLLKGTLPPIRGADVASLIDEIPVLSVLGSQAAGGFELSDAHELRVKESDRISAIVANLRSMGADVAEKPGGFIIREGRQLHGADIVTRGDHRIAMAFAVAALAAAGKTDIHDAECADVSFPGFWDALQQICR